MLRCAAFFVVAAYPKVRLILRICAPCLRTFFETVCISTYYEFIKIVSFAVIFTHNHHSGR